MSDLLSQAFSAVQTQAGKKRLAILVIDEADSIATERSTEQSHHEDKVAVNTLIQRIDEVRRLGGRVLVILCTNRFAVLDPAIVRRVARVERFERPNAVEREALFRMDLEHMEIGDATTKKLVQLTGPHGDAPAFTYLDIRTRLLPIAMARAFPDRALQEDDLVVAAAEVQPSPSLNPRNPS